MALYDVYRQDGSVERVEASSKSEASQKVRYAGELIKKVVEVEETTPTVATTPSPTTERPFDPRRETAPTTTTPTPTPTRTPVPGPMPSGKQYTYEQLLYGLQECQRWGGCQGMTVEGYAKSLGAVWPIGGETGDITAQYYDYLAFQKDNSWMPIPKDLPDYLANWEKWDTDEYKQLFKSGYTREQIDSYDRFTAFASKYGNIEDYQPTDLADYLANIGRAQQQLDLWVQEAGPEAAGFIDDEIRQFKDYQQWYYEYGKPGDWMPVDVGDFITNYETAQQQLSIWQQQAGEVDEYALDPGEAARRREEAYREGRYAAEERYRETPRYSETFAGWIGQQGDVSQALKGYIEKEYPSLRTEYQAGLPRLTGYPTREEARAEATRRETGWEAWLGEKRPEVYQEYMTQRPAERGERLWMQQPTMREVNW